MTLREGIRIELERLPSTAYSLAANLGRGEPHVRGILAQLEAEGVVCRCSQRWGSNWYRLADRPEPAVPPLRAAV